MKYIILKKKLFESIQLKMLSPPLPAYVLQTIILGGPVLMLQVGTYLGTSYSTYWKLS